MTNEMTLTLHCCSTDEAIRELTLAETANYLELIQGDWTHTGAVSGDSFGAPGVTVYAIWTGWARHVFAARQATRAGG